MTRIQLPKSILICVVLPISICMTASCEDRSKVESKGSNSAEILDAKEQAKAKPLMSVGTIKSTREMIKSLKLEGQSRAAEWGKIVFDKSKPKGQDMINMYQMMTTSANKGVWYVVGGNEVIGQPSSELHIALAGTDLRMFNPESTSDHLIHEHNFSERAARRDIRALKRENRPGMLYNDMIEHTIKTPEIGVLFEGRLINAQTQQPEGFATFVYHENGGLITTYITNEKGATEEVAISAETNLLPHMQDELARLKK